MEEQDTEENICKPHIYKGLVCRTYKELSKPNSKKKKPNRKWANCMKKYFSEQENKYTKRSLVIKVTIPIRI
jgi:hypothetical protein